MLSAPIPATRFVLQRAGLALSQIDLYEVNEAFASVPGAWAKEVTLLIVFFVREIFFIFISIFRIAWC